MDNSNPFIRSSLLTEFGNDFIYTDLQCDAIRKKKQFENLHFSRGYNFWTNDLIVILKTSTRPYSCLAKDIFRSEFV